MDELGTRNPFLRPNSFHLSLTATIVPEASRIATLAGSDFNPSNVATLYFTMLPAAYFDATVCTPFAAPLKKSDAWHKNSRFGLLLVFMRYEIR
jgi:hypothetical protein